MIRVFCESSRIHKPWIVAEGEYRADSPSGKTRWETDKIIGAFNLQREALNYLLAYQAGLLPKQKGRG